MKPGGVKKLKLLLACGWWCVGRRACPQDPMDLSLIQQRLKSGTYYVTLDIFTADLRRMFTNCRIYNAAETIYYKIANKLESFMDQWLNTHLLFDE